MLLLVICQEHLTFELPFCGSSQRFHLGDLIWWSGDLAWFLASEKNDLVEQKLKEVKWYYC